MYYGQGLEELGCFILFSSVIVSAGMIIAARIIKSGFTDKTDRIE